MTAEFPDRSFEEIAERWAEELREAEEFNDVTDAEIQAEITRRETTLDKLRAAHYRTEIRVVERRLESLRTELARRNPPPCTES